MPAANRRQELETLLSQRILVLDGAMGTMLQAERLEETDFRGARLRDHPTELTGNNDLLVLTRPDAVEKVHHAYCAAGADLIETDTFGATRIAQAEYGVGDLAAEINLSIIIFSWPRHILQSVQTVLHGVSRIDSWFSTCPTLRSVVSWRPYGGRYWALCHF